MHTFNNQYLYLLLHNGPHEVQSTSLMSASVTVRNISFEKTFVELTTEKLFPLANNLTNEYISDDSGKDATIS